MKKNKIYFLIIIIIIFNACSKHKSNYKKDMIARQVYKEYNIDTLKSSAQINFLTDAVLCEDLKNSILSHDFVYFEKHLEDTVSFRIMTEAGNKEQITSKENVIRSINDILSYFPVFNYTIYKGMSEQHSGDIAYEVDFTNIIGNEKVNLIRILFVLHNEKIIIIQLY